MRTAKALLPLLLILAATPALAQDFTETAAPKPARVFLGGNFIIAEPQQDFGDYVNTSFGGSVNLLWKAAPRGPLGLRVEGGMIGYGSEHQDVQLGRVTLDMTTSNLIGFAHVGPQLMLPRGLIQPYVSPSLGFTYIATVSSLSGDDSESFASDTNYKDFLFSYGATAGVLVPIARGKVPVSIDLSARYFHNGKASYLVEGSIQDHPDGITFDPIRSNANLVTFQIGVSAGIVSFGKKAAKHGE